MLVLQVADEQADQGIFQQNLYVEYLLKTSAHLLQILSHGITQDSSKWLCIAPLDPLDGDSQDDAHNQCTVLQAS